MGTLNDIGGTQERRKHRRFSLRYPVHVKFGSAESASEMQALSKNISQGGVLLETDSPIPQQCDVSFIMTVKEHLPIQIAGQGEVVRIEPHPSGAGFAVAIKYKEGTTPLVQQI
jgi:hypothetical protein